MIATIWKFVNDKILSNIFSISLLLLGGVLLVVAVSVGPKLLQKEKKTKRGPIEKKVDSAFKKVDDEIGESVVEDYEENEGDLSSNESRGNEGREEKEQKEEEKERSLSFKSSEDVKEENELKEEEEQKEEERENIDLHDLSQEKDKPVELSKSSLKRRRSKRK